LRARNRGGEMVTREVVGVVLLVAGVFFSAAFLSGSGAFLGEAGLVAVTHLLGIAGLSLAPLAAVAGLLLLLGRLPGRRALGAGLLLVAGATTLTSALPRELRFSSEYYAEAGGLLGSGVYGAVHWAGGTIGAALVLSLLYVVGLSLLTGVSPVSAFVAVKGWGEALLAWVRERRRSGKRPAGGGGDRGEKRRSEKRGSEKAGVRDLHAEIAEPRGGDGFATEELEVVLPEIGRAHV
jgi:S-DNA-T family DNA segregation ATPase FtsK/SpoIIIE